MTIYSQHASRGKIQILATFLAEAGVVSETVTSIESPESASAVVDALNRISACLTVPLTVRDERKTNAARYPTVHLQAATTPGTRPTLLKGSHSLWYEFAMQLLHEALSDLDEAVELVPPPVRKAIADELESEAGELLVNLAAYSSAGPPPKIKRSLDWEHPLVVLEGWASALDSHTRERLDELEADATEEELELAISDLRLLYVTYQRTINENVMFDLASMSMLDDDEPWGTGLCLTIDVRKTELGSVDRWNVGIDRWIPDPTGNPEDGDTMNDSILNCTLKGQPAFDELVELLDLRARQPERLARWAATPVGESLAGTAFVVTQRYAE